MHFKGFSIIKGSVSLGWKLHCWFKHPAPSLSLSEHSSDDDICSNHWVMSHLMLSPTSKVPCRDAEILREAEEGETKPTSWIGYVGGRRRKRLTLPSLLSHFWSPPGYKADRVTALYLWLGDILWELRKHRNGYYLYISCAQQSHEGDKAECEERRSQASTMHFFLILIDCRALSNLT